MTDIIIIYVHDTCCLGLFKTEDAGAEYPPCGKEKADGDGEGIGECFSLAPLLENNNPFRSFS